MSLVKRALFKSIGRANLRWGELEEVILDVEIAVNNRPLGYVEDDVQFPNLTPLCKPELQDSEREVIYGAPHSTSSSDGTEL